MPSFRVLIAAAGLAFAGVLAIALTLALPGSGAVQAQGGPPEFGARAAEVTPAAATLILTSRSYTSAKFALYGYVGTWYIKADKAPDNTCKSGNTDNTYSASGLTHNTEYTYTAYSDSVCTTQLGSPVKFTTLEQKITATEIGHNEATLSRVGFGTTDLYIKGSVTGAPHDTCSKKWDEIDNSEGEIALTGLTPGTAYTYTAYTDSACTGTAVATATFTTVVAWLSVISLGPTEADFSLTGTTGAWYIKANKAPDNTCKAATQSNNIYGYSSGTLTKGTEYTYTAYTASTCLNANKVDDVTFTTPSAAPTLTVSYVSPTTAQLSISEGLTSSWHVSADAFESGRCYREIDAEDRNIIYLYGLTPGATYTFKAYARISGVVNCTADIDAAVTFTTPAQLTECDSLSLVEAGVVKNKGPEAWIRYVDVKNNTDQAIRDVRALTYYNTGTISTFQSDPILRRERRADTLPEHEPVLQPGATGRIAYSSRSSFGANVAELNGVVQLVDPTTSAVLCETGIEPSWWREPEEFAPKGAANPRYWVSTQLDNPLPGAGGYATFTVTAYASTYDQLLQACVNLHFDGVTPVDADQDGHHDVVIYDGPNGKYSEDGTLNSNGYRRAGRLDYDSDGYDEDAASPRHRPQCSDADGKFEGGLFRIGNTERRTDSGAKWPTATGAYAWPLTYTVKVPVAATASGSGCLTATVRALPPERSDSFASAYEKSQDNTAKACLGAPPKGDPSLPVLFQEGRADLLTLHKCADGVSFPCAGKTAGNPVQYVDSSALAASGTGDANTGNAAANAGSIYRAFRPTDVVVHVADSTDTRKALNNAASPAVKQIYWQSGHDVKNQGTLPVLPGVAAKWIMPRSEFPGKVFCSSAADRTPNGRPAGLTINDGLWASTRANWAYFFNFKDASSVNETDKTADDYQLDSSVNPYPLLLEFRTLGTYVMDWSTSTKTSTNLDSDGYALDCRDSTKPTDTGSTDTGTYKFHVGPAADLRVYPGGASASVASGKRAFTIIAESEPTAEIDAESSGGHSHGEPEKINLESLRPTVTVTTNDAAIPAANVSQFGATAGSYDTATGVWALPDGFQGQATLTLVADASAVSSVKAAITNSAEVCENDAGAAQTTVDGRAAVDRATCEFNKAGTSSGNHWGSYQRCIKADASAVGDDPHHPHHISSKNNCTTTNNPNRTWHTTEWYDWRPHNNEVTFTPDAPGFKLNARGAGRSSIDLRWHRQAGADSYAIYSMATDNLTVTDDTNLGALLGANQIAVVAGDVTEYLHDGLRRGQKRHYLVRARQEGRPFAMSNLASAAAEIPTKSWPSGVGAPGSVSGMKAERASGNENVINVTWTAPTRKPAPSGYEVQYRSRTGKSGAWSDYTTLAEVQAETAYTFGNAGGGTQYQFQVRAVNEYGGGEPTYSGWQTATVDPVTNPQPVTELTAARHTANNTTDETKIDVSWKPPGNVATNTTYDIERKEDGGAWGTG